MTNTLIIALMRGALRRRPAPPDLLRAAFADPIVSALLTGWHSLRRPAPEVVGFIDDDGAGFDVRYQGRIIDALCGSFPYNSDPRLWRAGQEAMRLNASLT